MDELFIDLMMAKPYDGPSFFRVNSLANDFIEILIFQVSIKTSKKRRIYSVILLMHSFQIGKLPIDVLECS